MIRIQEWGAWDGRQEGGKDNREEGMEGGGRGERSGGREGGRGARKADSSPLFTLIMPPPTFSLKTEGETEVQSD